MNFFKYLIIRIFKSEVVVYTRINDIRKFYCKSKIEYFRTAQYGGEKEFLSEFMTYLKPNDVLWDIGSSIGIVSIYAAPLIKKVIAFEPDKLIFNRLSKNISLNKLGSKIQSLNLGIGETKGTISLHSDGVEGKSPSIANLGRHNTSYIVEIETIDNLVESGYEKPTIIKIDIEGAEMLALLGARKVFLDTHKPRLLFIEVHPTFLPSFNTSIEEIYDFLFQNGYTFIKCVERDEQIHIIAKNV